MESRNECNQPRCNFFPLTVFTVAVAVGLLMPSSHAATDQIDTVITAVAVTGGVDTLNPGTTCVKVAAPLSAACVAGYVAILNNNKQLTAAAHLNKALSAPVWFYYDVASPTPTPSYAPPNYHCPGRVFTQCSVISIESKP